MYRNYQEDEIDRYFKEQEGGFAKKDPDEFTPEPYVDEREVMRRKIEHEEKVARCSVFAKKYMLLFMILIGGIALSALSVVLAILAFATPSFVKTISTVIIILSFLSFAISVGYGLVLVSLGNYYRDFRTAGLLYMVNGAMSALYNSIGGGLGFLFQITAAVASVMYMLKFASAMSASFDNVASYMSISWDNFRKVFIYVYAGIAILTLGSFVPILGIFASLFLLVLSVVAIGVSIWQIVLIFKSSRVMKEHADSIFAG